LANVGLDDVGLVDEEIRALLVLPAARPAELAGFSELDSGTQRDVFRRVVLVYPEPGKNSSPSKMAPQGVFPHMGAVGARAHFAVHDLPLQFSQDRVGLQGRGLFCIRWGQVEAVPFLNATLPNTPQPM
jgi:hypothetical protein